MAVFFAPLGAGFLGWALSRACVVGPVAMAGECWLETSARRYRAMGRGAVFRLYIRNFWSEILHHRPKDTDHLDVRI